MQSRQRETNVRDWGDYREQGDLGSRQRKEWETNGDSEGLGRLQRPRRLGEVQSKQRKEWETPRDSEGLGRLERPRRPGEQAEKRVGD